MTSFLTRWRQPLLFTRQALIDPYRGNALGVTWLYVQPLVMILIYTLVFSRFMGARLSGVTSTYAYSLYLVPGLLLWTAFANTINGMVGIYQSKAYIIRKIPVNLLVMPLYIPLVEATNFTVAAIIFGLFCHFIGHTPGVAWLLLVPACLSTLLLAYALGLILAGLSPFLPDLRPMTNIVLQLAFWLTPIVYVPDILPAWAAALLKFHPLYWGIHQAQNAVLYGSAANQGQWIALTAIGGALLALAAHGVRALEKDIRDLL